MILSHPRFGPWVRSGNMEIMSISLSLSTPFYLDCLFIHVICYFGPTRISSRILWKIRDISIIFFSNLFIFCKTHFYIMSNLNILVQMWPTTNKFHIPQNLSFPYHVKRKEKYFWYPKKDIKKKKKKTDTTNQKWKTFWEIIFFFLKKEMMMGKLKKCQLCNF